MMDNDKVLGVLIGIAFGVASAFLAWLICNKRAPSVVVVTPGEGNRPMMLELSEMPVQQEQDTTLEERYVQSNKEKTKFIVMKPSEVSSRVRLLQLDGPGTLDELSIITDDQNARIIISSDGKIILNDTVRGLLDVSTYSNWLGAQELSGEYAVIMTNVKFADSFEVTFKPSRKATVKMIGKYTKVM